MAKIEKNKDKVDAIVNTAKQKIDEAMKDLPIVDTKVVEQYLGDTTPSVTTAAEEFKKNHGLDMDAEIERAKNESLIPPIEPPVETPGIPGKTAELQFGSKEDIKFEKPTEPAVLPTMKLSVEQGPTPVAQDSDKEIDFSHVGYEEIKVILSQYNFKHNSKLELSGCLLKGCNDFHDVEGLLKDIRDWYPDVNIIKGEGDDYEVIFSKE